MRTLLLPLLLTLGLSACGKNKSILDDWGGSDDILFLNNEVNSLSKENTFTLNSKIKVPKIGDGMSYLISATCQRTLSEESTKQLLYTKKTTNLFQLKDPTEISVINALPEEVMIFPEHFTSCDFEILVTNKFGSTDTSRLIDQKISLKNYSRKILVERKNKTLLFQTPSIKEVDDLLITTESGLLSEAKLICFSNKASTSLIYNNGQNSFGGELLTLPIPTKNFPLEYCIVTGFDFSNTAVISNRFKIFNRDRLHKTLVSHKPRPFHGKNPGRISYSEGAPSRAIILRLVLKNDSPDVQRFSFNEKQSVEKIYAIKGLKLEAYSITARRQKQRNHSLKLQPINTLYSWRENNNRNMTPLILEPGESVFLNLNVEPKFYCVDQFHALNTEIGFIIAPNITSPLLETIQIGLNDFVSEPYITGSLFTLNPNLKMNNNLPASQKTILDRNTEFQILYINSNTVDTDKIKLNTIIPLASNPKASEAFLSSPLNIFFHEQTRSQLTCSSQ